MTGPSLRQLIPYLEHPSLAITLVAGDSFRPLAPRHDREVLIVRDAWYPDDPEGDVKRFRRIQEPLFDRIYFLSNTEEMHRFRLKYGFNSHYVNIGCFIDTDVFRPPAAPVAKVYDAVMNARFTTLPRRTVVDRYFSRAALRGLSWWQLARLLPKARLAFGKHRELKRHWLTKEIERLALLNPVFESGGGVYKETYVTRANCKLANSERLSPEEVARIVAQSHAGLALSEIEGVCRASCEYLSSGVPVVSTPSTGGRDVWYDEDNSVLALPSASAVSDAVKLLKANARDPDKIRRGFLARAAVFKDRFRDDVLAPILAAHGRGLGLSAADVMRDSPFRWWL